MRWTPLPVRARVLLARSAKRLKDSSGETVDVRGWNAEPFTWESNAQQLTFTFVRRKRNNTISLWVQ